MGIEQFGQKGAGREGGLAVGEGNAEHLRPISNRPRVAADGEGQDWRKHRGGHTRSRARTAGCARIRQNALGRSTDRASMPQDKQLLRPRSARDRASCPATPAAW